jgi:hypothetical protein
MKIIGKLGIQSALVLALMNSVFAEPIKLDRHPYQTTANVATTAVKLTQGVVDLAGSTVNKVGKAVTKPLRDTEAPTEYSRKVDCQNAADDVAILQNERASQNAQFDRGVKVAKPNVTTARILQGEYLHMGSVPTEQYVFDIDARVSEIRGACYVP